MPIQQCPYCSAMVAPVQSPQGLVCPRCNNRGAPTGPPQAYAAPQAGAPNPYPARPQADGATMAMVFGILGLVVFAPLGIVGIVQGKKAQRLIAQSNGYLDGEGMAKAGIIMGWIGVGLMILGVIYFIVIFSIIASSIGSR